MRCRKVIKDKNTGSYNVVMFGSSGLIKPDIIKIKHNITENGDYNIIENGINFSICKKLVDPAYDPDTNIITDINYSESNITITNITDDDFDIEFKENPFNNNSSDKNYLTSIIIEFYSNSNLNKPYTYTYLDLNSNSLKYTIQIKKRANFYDENTHTSYAMKQEAVESSLLQRLSVIKSELWYHINYGLPLLDKINNKGIYDSVIIDIILSNPDVKNITNFNSKVDNHKYYFSAKIVTIFNEDIELSNNIG